jgi:hypothetical protein
MKEQKALEKALVGLNMTDDETYCFAWGLRH